VSYGWGRRVAGIRGATDAGKAATVPYSITGLAAGQHVLTIDATGIHNQSAKGSWVWIDGFDIVP